jgi:DNA-binding MarR family transcriptional regulator
VSVSEAVLNQFVDLLQRFIQLHPNLAIPEHFVRFRQQMESARSSGSGSLEDYNFLLRVFIVLAHRENPPTMGELSAELGVPLSSATRQVDWLVRANFVERVNDPHDRRVVRVRMTESGRQLYQIGIGYNKQQIAYLLKDFSLDEQTELLRLMTKLFDALLTSQG